MYAIPSTPKNGIWQVKIEVGYVTIYLPAKNIKHAQAIADAINREGNS